MFISRSIRGTYCAAMDVLLEKLILITQQKGITEVFEKTSSGSLMRIERIGGCARSGLQSTSPSYQNAAPEIPIGRLLATALAFR
jgi:hypothetical protein